MAEPLTDKRLEALARCYDNGMATALKSRLSPSVADWLVAHAYLKVTIKRPLTYVGKAVRLYSVTYQGKKELHDSGKRRVPGCDLWGEPTKPVALVKPPKLPKPIINDTDDGEIDKPFWMD